MNDDMSTSSSNKPGSPLRHVPNIQTSGDSVTLSTADTTTDRNANEQTIYQGFKTMNQAMTKQCPSRPHEYYVMSDMKLRLAATKMHALMESENNNKSYLDRLSEFRTKLQEWIDKNDLDAWMNILRECLPDVLFEPTPAEIAKHQEEKDFKYLRYPSRYINEQVPQNIRLLEDEIDHYVQKVILNLRQHALTEEDYRQAIGKEQKYVRRGCWQDKSRKLWRAYVENNYGHEFNINPVSENPSSDSQSAQSPQPSSRPPRRPKSPPVTEAHSNAGLTQDLQVAVRRMTSHLRKHNLTELLTKEYSIYSDRLDHVTEMIKNRLLDPLMDEEDKERLYAEDLKSLLNNMEDWRYDESGAYQWMHWLHEGFPDHFPTKPPTFASSAYSLPSEIGYGTLNGSGYDIVKSSSRPDYLPNPTQPEQDSNAYGSKLLSNPLAQSQVKGSANLKISSQELGSISSTPAVPHGKQGSTYNNVSIPNQGSTPKKSKAAIGLSKLNLDGTSQHVREFIKKQQESRKYLDADDMDVSSEAESDDSLYDDSPKKENTNGTTSKPDTKQRNPIGEILSTIPLASKNFVAPRHPSTGPGPGATPGFTLQPPPKKTSPPRSHTFGFPTPMGLRETSISGPGAVSASLTRSQKPLNTAAGNQPFNSFAPKSNGISNFKLSDGKLSHLLENVKEFRQPSPADGSQIVKESETTTQSLSQSQLKMPTIMTPVETLHSLPADRQLEVTKLKDLVLRGNKLVEKSHGSTSSFYMTEDKMGAIAAELEQIVYKKANNDPKTYLEKIEEYKHSMNEIVRENSNAVSWTDFLCNEIPEKFQNKASAGRKIRQTRRAKPKKGSALAKTLELDEANNTASSENLADEIQAPSQEASNSVDHTDKHGGQAATDNRQHNANGDDGNEISGGIKVADDPKPTTPGKDAPVASKTNIFTQRGNLPTAFKASSKTPIFNPDTFKIPTFSFGLQNPFTNPSKEDAQTNKQVLDNTKKSNPAFSSKEDRQETSLEKPTIAGKEANYVTARDTETEKPEESPTTGAPGAPKSPKMLQMSQGNPANTTRPRNLNPESLSLHNALLAELEKSNGQILHLTQSIEQRDRQQEQHYQKIEKKFEELNRVLKQRDEEIKQLSTENQALVKVFRDLQSLIRPVATETINIKTEQDHLVKDVAGLKTNIASLVTNHEIYMKTISEIKAKQHDIDETTLQVQKGISNDSQAAIVRQNQDEAKQKLLIETTTNVHGEIKKVIEDQKGQIDKTMKIQEDVKSAIKRLVSIEYSQDSLASDITDVEESIKKLVELKPSIEAKLETVERIENKQNVLSDTITGLQLELVDIAKQQKDTEANTDALTGSAKDLRSSIQNEIKKVDQVVSEQQRLSSEISSNTQEKIKEFTERQQELANEQQQLIEQVSKLEKQFDVLARQNEEVVNQPEGTTSVQKVVTEETHSVESADHHSGVESYNTPINETINDVDTTTELSHSNSPDQTQQEPTVNDPAPATVTTNGSTEESESSTSKAATIVGANESIDVDRRNAREELASLIQDINDLVISMPESPQSHHLASEETVATGDDISHTTKTSPGGNPITPSKFAEIWESNTWRNSDSKEDYMSALNSVRDNLVLIKNFSIPAAGDAKQWYAMLRDELPKFFPGQHTTANEPVENSQIEDSLWPKETRRLKEYMEEVCNSDDGPRFTTQKTAAYIKSQNADLAAEEVEAAAMALTDLFKFVDKYRTEYAMSPLHHQTTRQSEGLSILYKASIWIGQMDFKDDAYLSNLPNVAEHCAALEKLYTSYDAFYKEVEQIRDIDHTINVMNVHIKNAVEIKGQLSNTRFLSGGYTKLKGQSRAEGYIVRNLSDQVDRQMTAFTRSVFGDGGVLESITRARENINNHELLGEQAVFFDETLAGMARSITAQTTWIVEERWSQNRLDNMTSI